MTISAGSGACWRNWNGLVKVTFLENALIAYARHFPLRRGKMRLINALWRRAAGQGGFQREAVLRHGGFRLPCDISEMLQRQFYYFGTYFLEDEILACWENQARSAQTVFDIGANAGIFSLAALAANPHATVHAFEPTPEIAARLRATASMNGLFNLTVNEVAVGDHDGDATLRRWRGAGNSNEGMNFITTDGSVGEAVRLVSLDRYCADRSIERIDLLKIDIQGNEPRAFAGAARLLRERRIGTVFAELSWDSARPDEPAAQLVAMLADAGFVFSPPGANLDWRKPGNWMRDYSDVVAKVSI
jgi:FkbM family methyltransferase